MAWYNFVTNFRFWQHKRNAITDFTGAVGFDVNDLRYKTPNDDDPAFLDPYKDTEGLKTEQRPIGVRPAFRIEAGKLVSNEHQPENPVAPLTDVPIPRPSEPFNL